MILGEHMQYDCHVLSEKQDARYPAVSQEEPFHASCCISDFAGCGRPDGLKPTIALLYFY